MVLQTFNLPFLLVTIGFIENLEMTHIVRDGGSRYLSHYDTLYMKINM